MTKKEREQTERSGQQLDDQEGKRTNRKKRTAAG